MDRGMCQCSRDIRTKLMRKNVLMKKALGNENRECSYIVAMLLLSHLSHFSFCLKLDNTLYN